MSWSRRPYLKFMHYERRQLDVNSRNGMESYAGTCYHAEQLAEKTLKDKLWEFEADYRMIHNLRQLATDLAAYYGVDPQSDDYRDIIERCLRLDDLYQKSRYPSRIESKEKKFSSRIASNAMRDAYAICDWADSLRFPMVPKIVPYGAE